MSDFIKAFWENQAVKYKGSHEASWGDEFAIRLEIQNISEHIKKGDTVLDVGCSNGYATFHHLNKVKKIVGVDYSENMIAHANARRKKVKSKGKITFSVADIRNLPFEDNSFDVVYTTRVLINLSNWEEQKQGINECIRVTRPKGTVVFSEAFWEPLALLNAVRLLSNLPLLMEHDFNRYLKKEKLESYLKSRNISFKAVDFSSVYYLGSRFLRELVTRPKDYPGYSNPINKIFFEIEKQFSGGGFGVQQAYVIKK